MTERRIKRTVGRFNSVLKRKNQVAKWQREARQHGMFFVGRGEAPKTGRYIQSCGHLIERRLSSVRESAPRCDICTAAQRSKDAAVYGARFIRLVRYGVDEYELKCGHRKVLRRWCMTTGQFVCDVCDKGPLNEPSSVYLLEIATKRRRFIKVGVTNSMRGRLKGIRARDDVEIRVLHRERTDTGATALKVEQSIHGRYRDQRMTPDQAARYIKSGYTECYPPRFTNLLAEAITTGVKNEASP